MSGILNSGPNTHVVTLELDLTAAATMAPTSDVAVKDITPYQMCLAMERVVGGCHIVGAQKIKKYMASLRHKPQKQS